MKQKNLFGLFMIFLISSMMILNIGCKKEEENPVDPTPQINESEVLVKHIESTTDYVHQAASFVITPQNFRTEFLADTNKFYIIDIRAAADYNAGRLRKSVNVPLSNIWNHIKGLNLADYNKVMITCYSGQQAAFAVSMVRAMLPTLAQANKIVSLKWGMSCIDSTFAQNYWLRFTGNTRATQFVTTDPPAKPAKGSLPKLSTGKKTGAEILEARVNQALSDGFNFGITEGTVYQNLSNYFIINYWPLAFYKDPGHINGAYHYDMNMRPFKLDSSLTTMPTNKPIVLYCYTGQTSAYVGGYLRLLGYDVRTLVYGANSMIFDKMVATTVANFPKSNIFRPAVEIVNYRDLVVRP